MQKKIYKLIICISLLWGMIVTISRSIRLPNNYAQVHWLLDYRFGFVKRGLVGTVFSALFGTTNESQITEQLIACASLLVFALFCSVLLFMCYRLLTKTGWSREAFMLSAIFVTSPYIVMSAHLVGYYDNISVMCTFFSLYFVLKQQVWSSVVILTIGILIHESIIFTGIPLAVLFNMLICWKQLKSKTVGKVHAVKLIKSCLPFICPILLFVLLFMYQTIWVGPDSFVQGFSKRLAQFGFINPWVIEKLPP
jgi:uncharacterized membrane protein